MGREHSTCRKVRDIVSDDLLEDAFVPRKERHGKWQGVWRTDVVDLLKTGGYFIVATSDAHTLAAVLAKLTFPVQLAGAVGSGYAPISKDAQAFLADVMDGSHIVRLSWGEIVSTGEIIRKQLRVLKGPLVQCEHRIRRVDRRKKLAMVSVGSPTAGGTFMLALPLDVPVKREGTPESDTYAADHSADDLASIPLDTRDTSGRVRWYLATCAKGSEDIVCADLRARIPDPLIQDAFVPHMEQQYKYHGEWKIEDLVLLRGMFIVVTGEIRRLASKLVDMPSGVDLVRGPDKWPAPIALEAQSLMERVMDDSHMVRLSWGEIVDDELQVSSGSLKGLESRVASYNRGKRFATVRVRQGDNEHLLRLPIAITARRSSGSN